MIELNFFQLLCVANFLCFGLQQQTEDTTPLKLQYRPQSGNFFKTMCEKKSLEVFPMTSSIDMRRLFRFIYFFMFPVHKAYKKVLLLDTMVNSISTFH